ncbi:MULTISPECIES: DUF3592 domain-containing protein [Deefgea]|uniref:DUF3592 domain-containing protein n=1 Tax=Deefgea chitinilytica TaxID=570276 RepID=A0ABS2CAQ5_9NEIS|nr:MULTISPECIES: DUF3592 domain-containing protein [Deefgea]MBM5571224.1 DUF3592 domain-containing protein [Deefgea chitinilytica]MBM9888456.1 DUF3592 domain-containing protein [Deefgea sp. CFH1-16]
MTTHHFASQIQCWGRAYLSVAVYLQIGLGLLLLGFAQQTGLERLALLWDGQRAAGQIVRYIEVEPVRFSESVWFKAMVVYEHNGQQIEFADWNSREYASGVPQEVVVLFDPQQPSQAMIRRGNVLDWMPWAPFAVLGVFLLIVGLLGLVRQSNTPKNS